MSPRFLPPLAVAYLAAICGGCAQPDERGKLIAQRDQALAEAKDLREANHKLSLELEAQRKQAQSLLALGDKRLDLLYHVVRVELSSHTGGFSTDDRPGDEAVRVFLLPYDQNGSVIKAAGTITVQLYDLSRPEGRNLLGECRYSVQEAARHWYSGFLSYHYRLTCPWKTPPTGGKVTVRVEFLDYLTGKTFDAQKLCEISPAGATTTRPGTP